MISASEYLGKRHLLSLSSQLHQAQWYQSHPCIISLFSSSLNDLQAQVLSSFLHLQQPQLCQCTLRVHSGVFQLLSSWKTETWGCFVMLSYHLQSSSASLKAPPLLIFSSNFTFRLLSLLERCEKLPDFKFMKCKTYSSLDELLKSKVKYSEVCKSR